MFHHNGPRQLFFLFLHLLLVIIFTHLYPFFIFFYVVVSVVKRPSPRLSQKQPRANNSQPDNDGGEQETNCFPTSVDDDEEEVESPSDDSSYAEGEYSVSSKEEEGDEVANHDTLPVTNWITIESQVHWCPVE